MVFFLASLTGQQIFANHALLAVHDGDLTFEQTLIFKRQTICRTETAIQFICILWCACLPLWLQIHYAHMGLNTRSWLIYGGLFALLGLIVTAVIRYYLNGALIRRGVIPLNESETEVYSRNHRLQRNCVLVLAVIMTATALIHHVSTALYGPYSIVEGMTFHDYDSFKDFMEQEVPYANSYANASIHAPEDSSTVTCYDQNGHVISEDEALKRRLILNEGKPNEQVAVEYIGRNHSVVNISYMPKEDTLLPITVRTVDAMEAARSKVTVRNVIFGFIYGLEVAAALGFYRWRRACG